MPPILPHEKNTDPAVTKLQQTRFQAATGSTFPGPMLALGQLVHYRKVTPDKMSANAAPGIFAGWRFEHGLVYKKVTLVLDYNALQQKSGGYYNSISVPEQELYIPEGEPIFPLKAAADKALKEFNEASIDEQHFAPFKSENEAKGC